MSDELHLQIATTLGETGPTPIEQMRQIVDLVGDETARALLAETERLEASGGLLIERTQRRRSPGGVFFFLARQKCSDEALAAIFNERRAADGSFERLPKPKVVSYSFAGDWPGITPETYQLLCDFGMSKNFPRLDVMRMVFERHGLQALADLSDKARAEKANVKRRTFSDVYLTLAYAQLTSEEKALIPPLDIPEARYSRAERKKMSKFGQAQAPARSDRVAERRAPYETRSPRNARMDLPLEDVNPGRPVYPEPPVRPFSQRPPRPPVKMAPTVAPAAPAPVEPVDPTLNIADESLRQVAVNAGVKRPLTPAQVEILTIAGQSLGPERLAELASQTQSDLKTGGLLAQNGERLTAAETVLVYSAYARLNRNQRKALTPPQGWMS